MPISTRPFNRQAAALALAAAALLGQPAGAAPNDIGPPERFLEWENNHALAASSMQDCDIPPALAAQWDQNLQALARRLAQTPLTWPTGWVGGLSGFYGRGGKTGPACKGQPITGYITYSLWPPGKLKLQPGQTRLKRPPPSGEGNGAREAIYIDLNQRQGPNPVEWAKGSDGPRLTVGRQTGTLYGYPVWEDKWMLITPPQHVPPFIPATLEQVVKAWVAARTVEMKKIADSIPLAEAAKDKRLTEFLAGQVEGFRKKIDKVNQLLDGPAAQRQGPAYIGGNEDVAAQPTGNAQQVWADNPAYFDPKLPRTALQLIAIDVTYRDLDKPPPTQPDSKALVRQIFDRTDWAAMAKDVLK